MYSMARDVERDRIIRELRRASVPGDPMERAANYIENLGAGGPPHLPPNAGVAGGLHDMRAAVQNGARMQAPAPVAPDHSVRDMLTRTTLNMLGEERARDIATLESRSDSEYIQWLMDVNGGEYRHIAHLISLTARFAGEMPHELISAHAKQRIKAKVDSSQYVQYDKQIREVEQVVYDLVHQQQYPTIIGHPENAVVTELIPELDKLMHKLWNTLGFTVGPALGLHSITSKSGFNLKTMGSKIGFDPQRVSEVIDVMKDTVSKNAENIGVIMLAIQAVLPKLNDVLARFTGTRINAFDNYEAALRLWWEHTRMPQLQKEAVFHWLATEYPEFAYLQHFLRRTVQAWTVLVDPGLAGNARMACSDIASHNPRLRGLTMDHVMKCAKQLVHTNNEHDCMFLDFFCGAVAARWRANSVFAAQPYKTRNEQNAVAQALLHSNVRMHEFAIIHDTIQYDPRPPPSTLAELRNRQFPLYADL